MRIAGLLVVAALLGPCAPQVDAKSAQPSAQERDTAIRKGMAWLDRVVFKLPDASGTPRKQFTVATTGLVHLLARKGKGRRSSGRSVVTRSRAHYRYAELANGNFPYDPSQRSAHASLTGVSRAAGAVLAMHALGIPWSDVGIERALEFVDEHFDYLSEGHGSSTLGLLLAALMQRARGEKAWQRFRGAYFRRILDAQQPDGSLVCICRGKAFGSTNDSKPFGGKLARAGDEGAIGAVFGDTTKAYVTASHTLILLLDRESPRLLRKPGPVRRRAPVTPGSKGR